eukprot:365631-Chlamydomonas_euryale.AAC.8
MPTAKDAMMRLHLTREVWEATYNAEAHTRLLAAQARDCGTGACGGGAHEAQTFGCVAGRCSAAHHISLVTTAHQEFEKNVCQSVPVAAGMCQAHNMATPPPGALAAHFYPDALTCPLALKCSWGLLQFAPEAVPSSHCLPQWQACLPQAEPTSHCKQQADPSSHTLQLPSSHTLKSHLAVAVDSRADLQNMLHRIRWPGLLDYPKILFKKCSDCSPTTVEGKSLLKPSFASMRERKAWCPAGSRTMAQLHGWQEQHNRQQHNGTAAWLTSAFHATRLWQRCMDCSSRRSISSVPTNLTIVYHMLPQSGRTRRYSACELASCRMRSNLHKLVPGEQRGQALLTHYGKNP